MTDRRESRMVVAAKAGCAPSMIPRPVLRSARFGTILGPLRLGATQHRGGKLDGRPVRRRRLPNAQTLARPLHPVVGPGVCLEECRVRPRAGMLAAPPFIDGARALGHVAVVALADHDEGDALPIEGCIEREPRGRRLVAGGLGVALAKCCAAGGAAYPPAGRAGRSWVTDRKVSDVRMRCRQPSGALSRRAPPVA